MATAVESQLGTTKRERPADGGVIWHDRLNAFECLACNEFYEVRWRRERTPEKLAVVREMLVLDHTECWEWNDARVARLQRRFRKEMKRQKNLAAQKASWKGRA
jgi:hypothetical protein